MKAKLVGFLCLSALSLSVSAASYVPTANYVKPSDDQLKQQLTSLQYNVTQEGGTEKAFDNPYWNNEKAGIYVDVVSGEPLYSSTDKYDSKTGWPSFTQPIAPQNIIYKTDKGWFTTRTEVLSSQAHSHLGHVFNDGPPPTNKRYCMNSAALKFIPLQDMQKMGYGQYLYLFNAQNNAKSQ